MENGKNYSNIFDNDDHMRVAIVRTDTGEFTRTIHKLSPLPIEYHLTDNL